MFPFQKEHTTYLIIDMYNEYMCASTMISRAPGNHHLLPIRGKGELIARAHITDQQNKEGNKNDHLNLVLYMLS